MAHPHDDARAIQHVADLAAAFWTYDRLRDSSDPEEQASAAQWRWAYDAVDEATHTSAAGVVELLVALADEVAGDLKQLAYLGAGPFECLLRFGERPLLIPL